MPGANLDTAFSPPGLTRSRAINSFVLAGEGRITFEVMMNDSTEGLQRAYGH